MTYKKTLSVGEAAKRLGISRQAVHYAIERGDLKARKKIVQKVEFRIPEDEVESYVVNTTRRESGMKNRRLFFH